MTTFTPAQIRKGLHRNLPPRPAKGEPAVKFRRTTAEIAEDNRLANEMIAAQAAKKKPLHLQGTPEERAARLAETRAADQIVAAAQAEMAAVEPALIETQDRAERRAVQDALTEGCARAIEPAPAPQVLTRPITVRVPVKAAPKAAKPRRPANTDRKPAQAPVAESKTDKLLALMRRPEGASTEDLMSATGWLRHTVRGWISTANRKKGLQITSQRVRNVGPEQVGAKGSTTRYRLPA